MSYRLVIFVISLGLFTAGLSVAAWFSHRSLPELVTPLLAEIFPTPLPTPSPTPPPSAGLSAAVSSALAGSSGLYGVVVKDLKTGEYYYQNAHTPFEAGSLYKLWVMGAAYSQIQSRALDPNLVLSDTIPDLNAEFNISSDSAELTDGDISESVSDALNQMITISHNYSAMLLTLKLGLSDISDYMVKNGFTESSLNSDSQTTPSDMALFLEKLYTGKLADADDTAQMLSLLKAQTFNDGLPKLLPPGTVVAHKTGEIDNAYHDVGIVYSPKATYIIVVMTQSDSPEDAVNRIAAVSQSVYTYFNP